MFLNSIRTQLRKCLFEVIICKNNFYRVSSTMEQCVILVASNLYLESDGSVLSARITTYAQYVTMVINIIYAIGNNSLSLLHFNYIKFCTSIILNHFFIAFTMFRRFYRITTVGNERMLLEPRRKSKKLPVSIKWLLNYLCLFN